MSQSNFLPVPFFQQPFQQLSMQQPSSFQPQLLMHPGMAQQLSLVPSSPAPQPCACAQQVATLQREVHALEARLSVVQSTLDRLLVSRRSPVHSEAASTEVSGDGNGGAAPGTRTETDSLAVSKPKETSGASQRSGGGVNPQPFTLNYGDQLVLVGQAGGGAASTHSTNAMHLRPTSLPSGMMQPLQPLSALPLRMADGDFSSAQPQENENYFWCIPCGVEVSGRQTLVIHNNSDRHIRKQRALAENRVLPPDIVFCAHCRVSLSPLYMQRHVNTVEHRRALETFYRCDVCDVTVSGHENYKRHLSGGKHMARYQESMRFCQPLVPL